MKKEIILYTALIALILTLFSFELVVKKQSSQLDFNSFATNRIQSMSIDIPANIFFISGNDEGVVIEGQSKLLNLLELNDTNGHLALQLSSNNSFLMNLKTYLGSKETINLYVTSTNIANITVANSKGHALNSTLFNGDRGILKVDNVGLVQMIRASKIREKCNQSVVCARNTKATMQQSL